MELSRRKDRGVEGALDIPTRSSPWELKVQSSWVFPFLVTPARSRRIVRSDCDKKDAHKWGLGILMIVRYADSPVGPYDELLYSLPFKRPTLGMEILAPRRLPVIYVSSEASLRNGRTNWGIRKELADFTFIEKKGSLFSSCSVLVTDKYSGECLIDCTTYTVNIPIPVHLGLLGPLNPAIVERKIDDEGEVDTNSIWLIIKALGFGWASLTLTVPNSTPRLAPSWFGAYVGLSMKGTLIFPEPTRLDESY